MSRPIVRTPVVEFGRGKPVASDGDVVRRKGVIFRAGDYPDKAFAITPAELKRRVVEFSPVPVDLGHPSAPSPLDGKFGELESVELSEDGTTLFGTVAFPRWLDEMMGDARRKVSPTWDRADKRLRSLSLVTHPRISDAELQAAFACACGHADVPTTKETRKMAEEYTLTDEEKRAVDRLRAMPSDERTGVLAVLDGDYTLHDEPEEDEIDEPEPGPPAADAAFARIAELEAKDRRRDAEFFVDGAIKDHLVLPAERARLVARHAQFALDDELAPAQFADGKPLSRVAEFQADIRARKAHGWGRDAIAGTASFGRTLDARGDQPETDAEYAARVNKKHYRVGANGPA